MHTEINIKPRKPTSPVKNGNWGKSNFSNPGSPATGKN